MRVLVLTGEYPPDPNIGGIASFALAGAEALVAAGAEVHVLCCRVGGRKEDRVGPGGEHVHERPIRRALSITLGRLGLSSALAFALEARRHGPFDVIEAPDWDARSSTAHRLSSTLIVRRYGATAGNRLRERAERWALARADAVTTYSPLTRGKATGRRS